jgi:hypothetical protein
VGQRAEGGRGEEKGEAGEETTAGRRGGGGRLEGSEGGGRLGEGLRKNYLGVGKFIFGFPEGLEVEHQKFFYFFVTKKFHRHVQMVGDLKKFRGETRRRRERKDGEEEIR